MHHFVKHSLRRFQTMSLALSAVLFFMGTVHGMPGSQQLTIGILDDQTGSSDLVESYRDPGARLLGKNYQEF